MDATMGVLAETGLIRITPPGVTNLTLPLPGAEPVTIPNIRQLRGCPACHQLIVTSGPLAGGFTLPWEAHFAVMQKRGVDTHPNMAPDGTSIKATDDVNVKVCLQCHAPGEGGRGNAAYLSLRDIVHPAHMTSGEFKLTFGGSCFSCHNVNANAEFEVLTEAVDVDEKGIPEEVPIPGAVLPHE